MGTKSTGEKVDEGARLPLRMARMNMDRMGRLRLWRIIIKHADQCSRMRTPTEDEGRKNGQSQLAQR